jgi:hypothetical protein
MTPFEQYIQPHEFAHGSPTPQFKQVVHRSPPVLENSSFNAAI